ncbi:MAG: hypothetical protein ACK56I_17525, partial [bacterium]
SELRRTKRTIAWEASAVSMIIMYFSSPLLAVMLYGVSRWDEITQRKCARSARTGDGVSGQSTRSTPEPSAVVIPISGADSLP